MPEAKAVNEASGKVANNKVVLNLGALPPKQNIADMKKDGQNVSFERPERDRGSGLIFWFPKVPANSFRK